MKTELNDERMPVTVANLRTWEYDLLGDADDSINERELVVVNSTVHNRFDDLREYDANLPARELLFYPRTAVPEPVRFAQEELQC